MKFKRIAFLTLLSAAGLRLLSQSLLSQSSDRASDERLSFQTSGPWSPRTNLNADVAMIYGIGPRMPANIETYLLDLNGSRPQDFKLLAAACRVRDEHLQGLVLQFRADGIGSTNGVVRLAAPSAPTEVTIDGKAVDPSTYDYADHLLRLRFANSPEPLTITVRLSAR